ncbi:MAG: DegT/DnrJ/EryC1/StrS family aminotransferase [Lachnospiraceae bacterium]|nr:DegT/DnrJ/EryC1/StrS family aminotransferase [Lachnospiraceae bacterium]
MATTSFFPAKPLGCYGDGGAIFTDNDEWAELIRSFRIHGKGADKYDNVRIGMNSRLDTMQAAVLQVKLQAFREFELEAVNRVAQRYTDALRDVVTIPVVKDGFYSSWAQYTILLPSEELRNGLQAALKEKGIPSMVYYPKAMHEQGAFRDTPCVVTDLSVTTELCKRVLALPMHPYLDEAEQRDVIEAVKEYLGR